MKKELKVDLRGIQNQSLLELEKVIVMYGFSYHACKTCNVSRIDTLTRSQIILFCDLDKKIQGNLGGYHALYMSSIAKKCVDDLYHLLEAVIIDSWKEVRKIRFDVDNAIHSKYEEFLSGKYDDSIWKVIPFCKKLNFNFPSEITQFLHNLKELRKTLHYGNVLKEDVRLAYKGINIKCFGTKEDQVLEIELDEVVDTYKYDKNSIYFEYGKSLMDRVKDFKRGSVPEFKPNEFQELCLTVKDYILPTISRTFFHFLENSFKLSNIKFNKIE